MADSLSVSLIRSINQERRLRITAAAVKKYCRSVGLSREELAAKLDTSAHYVNNWLDNGKFPGPVCYILSLWMEFQEKQLTGQHSHPETDPVTDYRKLVNALKDIADGKTKDPQKFAQSVLYGKQD